MQLINFVKKSYNFLLLGKKINFSHSWEVTPQKRTGIW